MLNKELTLIDPLKIVNVANPNYNLEMPRIGDPQGVIDELNRIKEELVRAGIQLIGATVYVEEDYSIIYNLAFTLNGGPDDQEMALLRNYLSDWTDNNCYFPSIYRINGFVMITLKVLP